MTTGTGISERLAAAAAAGMLSEIDGAGQRARWMLYSAPRPGWGEAAAATLLAELPLALPSGTVVGSALVFTPTSTVLAIDAGVPAWARLVDGNGAYLADVRARLTSEPDDPADPAVVIVQASEVVAGVPIALQFGQLYLVG